MILYGRVIRYDQFRYDWMFVGYYFWNK